MLLVGIGPVRRACAQRIVVTRCHTYSICVPATLGNDEDGNGVSNLGEIMIGRISLNCAIIEDYRVVQVRINRPDLSATIQIQRQSCGVKPLVLLWVGAETIFPTVSGISQVLHCKVTLPERSCAVRNCKHMTISELRLSELILLRVIIEPQRHVGPGHSRYVVGPANPRKIVVVANDHHATGWSGALSICTPMCDQKVEREREYNKR